MSTTTKAARPIKETELTVTASNGRVYLFASDRVKPIAVMNHAYATYFANEILYATPAARQQLRDQGIDPEVDETKEYLKRYGPGPVSKLSGRTK